MGGRKKANWAAGGGLKRVRGVLEFSLERSQEQERWTAGRGTPA